MKFLYPTRIWSPPLRGVWGLLLVLGVVSCDLSDQLSVYPDNVEGLVPVYATPESIEDIRGLEPQAMQNPGKIYAYADLLLVNERFKGVHLINNADPANPVNMGFIRIPGNVDIAVKGNLLYADNYTDLIAIDLNNLTQIQVVSRIKDQFEPVFYPTEHNVYFQCPDATKGVVIDWEWTTLSNPDCYRP